MQRWHETGSVAAKPSGGNISPLEEHADFLLALIAEQPAPQPRWKPGLCCGSIATRL
jgi:hypothetical protein